MQSSRKRQTRSPSPGAEARSNAAWLSQREQRDLEEEIRAAEVELRRLQQEARENEHETNIDDMIRRINEQTLFGIPYVNLDPSDPDTRYAVGMVVRTHGMGKNSLGLLRRSPVLFRILTDSIRRSGIGGVVCSAGSTAAECARVSGRLLSSSLSRFASAASSRFRRAIRPSERIQQQQQLAIDDTLARQLHQPGAEASLAVRSRQQQLEMDKVLAHHLDQSSLHPQASASAAGPAPSPPPPLPQAPEEEEDECSICMAPLTDTAVLTRCNHKFHRACITPWLNSHDTCPLCRNENPTPLVPAPAKPTKRQRQGGGGSRKTRSKSKSKSKTRRLRKSRKPRKSCKSRKPRSLSYRRK